MKKSIWLTILFVFILANSAWATKQVIQGSTGAGYLNSSGTQYLNIFGGGTAATEAQVQFPFVKGTFRNFRVFEVGDPGAGNSFTITLMVNDLPTDIVITVDSTNYSTIVLDTHTARVNTDYHKVDIKVVANGTPGSKKAAWSIEFDGDVNGDTILGFSSGTTGVDNAATNYLNLSGYNLKQTAVFAGQIIAPFAGTMGKLYAVAAGSPGASPRYFRVTATVEHLGTYNNPASTVTGDITSASPGYAITSSNTISFVAGDLLTIMVEPSATAPTSQVIKGCIALTPTTAGNFTIATSSGAVNPSTTAVRYGLMSANTQWATSANTPCPIATAFTCKGIWAAISTDPTTSYEFKYRNDTSNPPTTAVEDVTITSPATSNSATSDNTFSVTELCDMTVTPVATAASVTTTVAMWGSLPAVAATITSQAVSDITTDTATGNGTVVDTGGDAVTELGVCIGASANPTTGDTKFTGTVTQLGAYTAAMTSLTPSTHYHARAYAITANSTAYGSDVEFDTGGGYTGLTINGVAGVQTINGVTEPTAVNGVTAP